VADNLSIQFGADASKLLGQIKLVGAELKNLGREIDKAVKSGDVARAGQLSQQFGKMQTTLGGLNKTAADTGVIVTRSFNNIAGAAQKVSGGFEDIARSGQGFRRLVGQFSSMERGLESIGSIVGGLAGGFAGAFAGQAVGQAINYMLGSLDALSQKLTKLQDQAREFGQRPIDVQAFQELAQKAGRSLEDGAKLIAGAGKIVEDAFAKMAGPGDIIKIQQGADGLFHTFKNGVEVVKDLTSPLEVLQLNLNKFKNAADPARAATAALLAAFVEFANKWGVESAKVNKLSKEMFGVDAKTALEIIPKNFADIDAAINKLAGSARGATGSAQALNRELLKSRAAVEAAKEEAFAPIQKWFMENITALNNWRAAVIPVIASAVGQGLANASQNFANWLQTIQEGLANASQNLSNWGQSISDAFKQGLDNASQNFTDWGASLKSLFDQVWAGILQGWTDLWSSVGQLASNTLNWIIQKANDVAAAIARLNPFSGGSAGPATAPSTGPPMASGGMVRGPGTGTSDSVLARLSAGEYVMRARAVDHWGPRFMASLNALRSPSGFAGGGLVMPRHALPHFADGGLVAAGAGGGTPVHLHLGGHSFALSGAGGVVDALVTEAHRHKIRSAGTKPSWYGGRPGH
jgi:prefoldin subunit 5